MGRLISVYFLRGKRRILRSGVKIRVQRNTAGPDVRGQIATH